MHCIHCGEVMEGDGYTIVYHCPSVEVDGVEPDADPVYCEHKDDENVVY